MPSSIQNSSRALVLASALLFAFFVSIGNALHAAEPSPFGLVAASNLDNSAFAQWLDGKESPIVLPPNEASKGENIVVWTDKSGPIHTGVAFGEANVTGIRHLRIGFRDAVLVGSIMVRGGGAISVLTTSAAYPGDLGKDEQWENAERIDNARVGRVEVAKEDYAMWVLPKPAFIRAIRFSHTTVASDKTYAGWLGAIALFDRRLANVAPFSVPTSNLDTGHPELLIDGHMRPEWQRFDSYDKSPTRPEDVVSEEHPAWVMLAWSKPVALRGLAALSLGALTADAQIYAGPESQHPREAREEDWKTIKRFTKLEPEYPRTLPLRWLDFGETVTTRAVRLKMVQAIDPKRLHSHLHAADQDGRRVFISELMALTSLGDNPLASIIPQVAEEPHPPIPIRFKLAEAGFVTLTIDDKNQRRVRNLISESAFPAGENTAWWDGLDDLGRDPDAAKHGLYNVPGSPVLPGDYIGRGIWHKDVNLRYEFPIYTAGNPAWNTEDKTGAWLANHTPPQAALFVPAEHGPNGKAAIYLGSYVSEGTHGLAWVDLDGKKLGGVNWIGGAWTGAPYLARDASPHAIPEHIVYVASVWETGKASGNAELRLTAMTAKGEQPIYREEWQLPGPRVSHDDMFTSQISGVAANDGVLVAALKRLNKVVLVDATSKKRKGEQTINDLRGLAFDSQGRLLVLSGKRLLRFAVNKDGALGQEQAVVTTNLEDPQHIVADVTGRYFISDGGASHQVKVFDASGKFQFAIGKKGTPAAGPYDEKQMRNPAGITLDNAAQLWVAERDEQPKRVSVWKTDGTFVRAFYGPSEYGGGGTLDPKDASLFHYHGMSFALDWTKGTFALKQIYYPGADAQALAFRCNFPEAPIYVDGRRYWTNAFNSNPTGGHGSAFVFVDREGVAVSAAGCGRANGWDALKADEFKSRWPKPVNPKEDLYKQEATFVWSDLNGDGHVQPDEVTIIAGRSGGVTVMNDLAMVISRVDGKTLRLPAQRFTDKHVPIYDLAHADVLAEGVEGPKSSGGDQVLVHPNGWSILTLGVAPYSPYSICGVFKGQTRWAYPNPWPGLHASHEAPVPDRLGEVIGATRLLGSWIEPKGSDVGPLWFVNANMGNVYVFTADGMFVRTLFHDSRTGKPWAMPRAERGMSLNDITLHDENFWPTVAQTPAGDVIIQDGGRSSLIRVEGLETLRRLPEESIHIGDAELQAAVAWRAQAEIARQREHGTGTLVVSLSNKAPNVDGKLDDWNAAQWASIDKRGTKANFNSSSRPYDLSAALTIADGRLFAAFKTGDKDLLKNSGEEALAPFKTGGALDLMLGTDPNANPKRTQAAPGDLRLLVTLIGDANPKKPPVLKALLYRAVVPGTSPKDRVPFSSPWRTITFDRVEDVSSKVVLNGQNGDFEFSIPLETLGLKVAPGTKLKGDLGILRGNGFQTHYRVYWSNKATAITADVPSEAELNPGLWGTFEFKQ